MNASTELAHRLREVILNGKWIANTNLQDELKDVTLDIAQKRPDNLNSIAMLTFHINYYIAGVMNVFKGGDLEIRDKYSFDLPELTTEEDWNTLKGELLSNAEQFAQCVENMPESQLSEVFVREEYGDYRRSIEGIIEHSYYHLGQVKLIKKLAMSR